VHSVQVMNITEIFTNYFLREKPEVFISMLGTENADVVQKSKSKIIGMVRKAGLCHDIGKATYMNTVALCSRRLYDIEYSIIKQHVNAGGIIGAANENIECAKDVIMGHHKWYDGSSGYPMDFNNRESKYAFVIDMVSVADSIDAATDVVGRSYAHGRTLEQVVEEIKQQSGVRYSPIIAEALGDESLFKEVSACIYAGRENVYYDAYVDIVSRNSAMAV